VTFVDSNVFIYAVGRPHPLREQARQFFRDANRDHTQLVTSAEVLQELLHVYLPLDRLVTLDDALKLATDTTTEIIPVTERTVRHARNLADRHSALTARDLLHLAVCELHDIPFLKTFDRALRASFAAGRRGESEGKGAG